jgi:hypothetical protein
MPFSAHAHSTLPLDRQHTQHWQTGDHISMVRQGGAAAAMPHVSFNEGGDSYGGPPMMPGPVSDNRSPPRPAAPSPDPLRRVAAALQAAMAPTLHGEQHRDFAGAASPQLRRTVSGGDGPSGEVCLIVCCFSGL